MIKGHTGALTQTVEFRAYDGKGWSNWTSVSVKTIDPNANTAPTLSVNVPTLSVEVGSVR